MGFLSESDPRLISVVCMCANVYFSICMYAFNYNLWSCYHIQVTKLKELISVGMNLQDSYSLNGSDEY